MCCTAVHTLTVITGHGSHSSNGRAKIKPAVCSWHCLSRMYSCSRVQIWHLLMLYDLGGQQYVSKPSMNRPNTGGGFNCGDCNWLILFLQSVHILLWGWSRFILASIWQLMPVHCYELQVIRFLLKREIPWREGNIGCLIIKMKDVWNKDLDPIDPDSPTEYENK